MILNVGKLTLHALPGPGYTRSTWYRTVREKYAAQPLDCEHTRWNGSRFKPSAEEFSILYLAPDYSTALLEAGALLSHPRRGTVPGRSGRWQTVRVNVRLDRVVDLRTTGERNQVATTVQELTGDWLNYAHRTASTPDVSSTPPAPTQNLGVALYQGTDCQGFLTPSARNSMLPNLVVFPDRVSIDRGTLTIQP